MTRWSSLYYWLYVGLSEDSEYTDSLGTFTVNYADTASVVVEDISAYFTNGSVVSVPTTLVSVHYNASLASGISSASGNLTLKSVVDSYVNSQLVVTLRGSANCRGCNENNSTTKLTVRALTF